MCGIVGSLGTAGTGLPPAVLSAMLSAVGHRGPDDHGAWSDSAAGIALGQTRLSIIDLSSAGHQPMTDASGRYTIVFNGEIYNYRELRDEPLVRGVAFRGHSDTEVLLELFARVSADVLPRLNGIFALAIWDAERHELWLARDSLGVKPLYYTEAAAGFAFASELKALLPALETRTLDALSLHRYMTYLWCPGAGTPLREVRKLQPGEVMVVRDGRIAYRSTWYELPARRGVVADLPEAEAATATAASLRTAVQRQLVADVPVGAFLSGGLDSSSIAAFARESVPGLRCFTIDLVGGHDRGFADDLPYAKRVAAHLGVRLDVVEVPADRMAADLEDAVWMLDEPLADPAPLNVLYISRLAREHGIKVLLSGAGGDDLFSGYRRHLSVSHERLWSWMPAAGRRRLARMASGVGADSAGGRRLQRWASNLGMEGDERLAGYFAWITTPRLASLYTPEFAAELGGQRANQPMIDFLAGVPGTLPPLERLLALEQRFFLADHNLGYTDRMSMATGVEVRVPFLDTNLVDLAARIPAHCKQRGRVGKWVLKEAMAPHLPADVIHRPKTGFGAPLRRWLRQDLRPLADILLGADVMRRRGIFEPAAVQALRAADEQGQLDASYTLLAMMCIEIWSRRFLDRGAA